MFDYREVSLDMETSYFKRSFSISALSPLVTSPVYGHTIPLCESLLPPFFFSPDISGFPLGLWLSVSLQTSRILHLALVDLIQER